MTYKMWLRHLSKHMSFMLYITSYHSEADSLPLANKVMVSLFLRECKRYLLQRRHRPYTTCQSIILCLHSTKWYPLPFMCEELF